MPSRIAITVGGPTGFGREVATKRVGRLWRVIEHGVIEVTS
jgi:hypothetical protein